MTRTFFADSSNWIALLRPRDRVHRPAQPMAVELADEIVVTTEMLLVEVFNHMSRGGETARRAALRLVLRLQQDPQTKIVPQTTGQFRPATRLYADRPDQRWSLTDGASVLVMEGRGIAEALAYDRDFEEARFAALLRNQSLERDAEALALPLAVFEPPGPRPVRGRGLRRGGVGLRAAGHGKVLGGDCVAESPPPAGQEGWRRTADGRHRPGRQIYNAVVSRQEERRR